MKKWLKRIGIAIVIILVGIQLIPVNRTNPPVTREVKWDAPTTRALAQRACFDCHSNETIRPWYGYVAPVSLLLANHIDEGRGRLNFSEWDQPNSELDEVEESIQNNQMPTGDFLLMHPQANLTAAEKTTLVTGFRATFSQDPPIARQRGPGGD
jgi:Haem-binding domain